MATTTALRHVRSALCDRLALSDATARRILCSATNMWMLDTLEKDMRDCIALVDDQRRDVDLYVPDERGVILYQTTIVVDPEHHDAWRTMSLEDAYRLPKGVRFSSADADATDDRIERSWLKADLDPSEAMDLAFGRVDEDAVPRSLPTASMPMAA